MAPDIISDFDISGKNAKLRFESYSFMSDKDGRTVEGYTMSLVFPWGKVKLRPVGLKAADVLHMLSYAFSDDEEE